MAQRLVRLLLFLVAATVAPTLHADGEPCTGNTQCAENEYCSLQGGSCLSSEPHGVCRFVPPGAGCPAIYMPVCGCDLQTYSNGCEAELDYVSLLYPGVCQPCGSSAPACQAGRSCRITEGECASGDLSGVCIPSDGPDAVSFTFDGVVDQVFDGLGLLEGQIGSGSRFHGSLTLDLTTPDTGGIWEGQFGVFLHEAAPSGARLALGPVTVRTVPEDPEMVVFVNDEVGFAGADEFGFDSRRSELAEQAGSAELFAIEFRWTLSELFGNPIQSVELPICPPDIELFENNQLYLRIDCLPCAGPASFIEMSGRVERLESDRVLRLAGDQLHWNSTEAATAVDLIVGDLERLGDFSAATDACVADDVTLSSLTFSPDPPPGSGWWFLARSVYADANGSWDSSGLRQQAQRDAEIEQSGAACP